MIVVEQSRCHYSDRAFNYIIINFLSLYARKKFDTVFRKEIRLSRERRRSPFSKTKAFSLPQRRVYIALFSSDDNLGGVEAHCVMSNRFSSVFMGTAVVWDADNHGQVAADYTNGEGQDKDDHEAAISGRGGGEGDG